MEKKFGFCSDCDFKKDGICTNPKSKHHKNDVPGGGCKDIYSGYLQHTHKPKKEGDTIGKM